MGAIVGIDPGTQCGWAVLDEDTGERIASGVWDLGGRRLEGGGMRYLRLRGYLRELFVNEQVTALGYEEVRRHIGTDAAHIYGGIVGVVMSMCEQRGIPYRAIPVGTVKKHATGKGNADKDAMVTAAWGRWSAGLAGYWVSNPDEADALWIADTLRVDLGSADAT